MNKKLCIAACVYGRKYQGWIPLYIYSIQKNYPEYDIKIFLDKKLSVGIRRILEKHNLYHKAEFIENIDFNGRYGLKSEMEKRCFRWLASGYGLEDYDYVYWGDIDIYIVREDPTLLEQHISDMIMTNHCYSNAIRLSVRDYLSSRKKAMPVHLFRLTGLHLVKTHEYYSKVSKTQERLVKYLKGRRVSVIDKIFFRDDERCLWLVNFLSGMEMPKESYEIYTNVFRPLHGIHFAIGRAYEEYIRMFENNSIHFREHDGYYRTFLEEYNSDQNLRNLIFESSFYIVDTIRRMCTVWKGNLLKNEIKTGQQYLGKL